MSDPPDGLMPGLYTLGFSVDGRPPCKVFDETEPASDLNQCANPDCTRPAKIDCEKCKVVRYCAKRCRAIHCDKYGHHKTCRPGSMEFEIHLYENSVKNTDIARLISCPLESTFTEFADVIKAAFNWRSDQIWDFRVHPKDSRYRTPAEVAKQKETRLKVKDAMRDPSRFPFDDYSPGTFAWPFRPYFLRRIVRYDVPFSRDSFTGRPASWYIPGDRQCTELLLFADNLDRWHQRTPETNADRIRICDVLDEYPGYEIDFTIDFRRGWRHRVIPRRRHEYCDPVCHPQFRGHHPLDEMPFFLKETNELGYYLEDLNQLLTKTRHQDPTKDEKWMVNWYYKNCLNGGCLCHHLGLKPAGQCYKGGVVNGKTPIYKKLMCKQPVKFKSDSTTGEWYLDITEGILVRDVLPVLSKKKQDNKKEEGTAALLDELLALDKKENDNAEQALPGQGKNKRKKDKAKNRKKNKQSQLDGTKDEDKDEVEETEEKIEAEGQDGEETQGGEEIDGAFKKRVDEFIQAIK